MQNTKKWYQSKGVWIGILTALTGIIGVAQEFIIMGDFSTLGFLMACGGVLKIIERVMSHGEMIVVD